MLITFGKYKGKDIKNVPDGYINWVIENIDKKEIKRHFLNEYNRRNELTKYDPLIFGKDSTEKVVNITHAGEEVYVYTTQQNDPIKFKAKPWCLTDYPSQKFDSIKLKGKQHYKYLTEVDYKFYEENKNNWDLKAWWPRSNEEGYMLRSGYTYFKGMTINEVSILSFDIEATSLNPKDKNAEVILISNTYRDRIGNITKKLFDIYDYKNQQEMIESWVSFVQEKNPDIFIGHNIFGYDFPYIAEQVDNLALGRDGSNIYFNERPSKFRKDGSQQYDYYNANILGREIIDTMFLSIKYDVQRQFPSYALKSIEKHLNLVDENRIEWDFDKYKTKDYKSWPKGKWEEFKQYCIDDGDSPLAMFDIMAPPFFYLTQAVPKTFQQIINEASGSQLDSLMIRSYLQDGYSQPKTSGKVKFEGAISMGIPGTYDNVRKVDVASLYPSIMLEYEIFDKQKDPEKHLVKMLTYFREERLKNKKLAKETGEKKFDDLQASQKIFLNSLYGFMGAGFLLYNYPKGAASVTKHGREILQKGVEWACGFRLKKVIKNIRNKGKENEEIRYEWIPDEKTSEGLGYQLVNVDTDSFSYTNNVKPSQEEFEQEISELNKNYPSNIIWESDGIFDRLIVVKAKNYVMKIGNKVKFKGSSVLDQKKEPLMQDMMKDMFNSLLEDKEDLLKIYDNYIKKVNNIKDLNKLCVKKTVTKSVLNPERMNEQKVADAIKDENVQEGDKVYLYSAVNGKIQKIEKGEPVVYSDGSPKMVKNTILKLPKNFNNDLDTEHYTKRVYDTVKILENIVNLKLFPKYHLKSNQKKLQELLNNG